MKSIDIDEQVFEELARRATGFNVTPNDVLRRILDLTEPFPRPPVAPQSPSPAPVASTLAEFIRSDQFQRHHQTVDRYLVILGWLHSAHPSKLEEAALSFHRGSRIYFAKTKKEILDSGTGVTAKQIPQSPFWTLATLDNKSKRLVLEEILRALDYSSSDIKFVLEQLPDSGIRRSHGRSQFLANIHS